MRSEGSERGRQHTTSESGLARVKQVLEGTAESCGSRERQKTALLRLSGWILSSGDVPLDQEALLVLREQPKLLRRIQTLLETCQLPAELQRFRAQFFPSEDKADTAGSAVSGEPEAETRAGSTPAATTPVAARSPVSQVHVRTALERLQRDQELRLQRGALAAGKTPGRDEK